MLTWDEIIVIEPRILELYEYAKSIKDDKSSNYFCANEIYAGKGPGYGGLKIQIKCLVGDDAVDDRLSSYHVYDLVSQKIYKVLPDCRNCGCM